MKTLGMIGGTTWVSTADYYRILNEEVNKAMGGNYSAPLLLYSVNFQEALDLIRAGDSDGMFNMLLKAAKTLQNGGVDGLLLGANTIHKFAERIQAEVPLPIIHIADETAEKINEKGLSKVGLLGTMPTMRETFYKDRLLKHGIEAVTPDPDDMVFLHHIIFSELGLDIFKDSTRDRILKMMDSLYNRGAEAMILGCTEIPLIIKTEHTSIPLFDTLRIHAEAGARFIISNKN